MVMAATNSGMCRRTRRGLPLTPSHAEGSPWRGAFIYPAPNASLAKQWTWSVIRTVPPIEQMFKDRMFADGGEV